jgi:hypothetical protein
VLEGGAMKKPGAQKRKKPGRGGGKKRPSTYYDDLTPEEQQKVQDAIDADPVLKWRPPPRPPCERDIDHGRDIPF